MKENQNSGAKIGMVVFLIISILLGGYIVYDKVLTTPTNNTEDSTIKTGSNQNNLLTTITSNEKNPSITSLTISNVKINPEEYMDNHLTLAGTINLSMDDNLYEGVSLEGYCIDTNNKRYSMYGPQDGRALFHNGANDLSLSEDLKIVKNVNWKNVTIKYCKIDKMTAYVATIDDNNLAKLSITKSIDLNYEKNF